MPPLTLFHHHAATELTTAPRAVGTYGHHANTDILPVAFPQAWSWRVWQTPWWRRRRYPVAAVLAALVVIAPICVAYRHPIWQQVQLSTVRQPVAYNELYFTASTALPVHVTAEAASEVTFAVRRDGSSTVVRYNVVLTDAQGTNQAGSGSVRLNPGPPAVVSESFRVPVKGPFVLEVTLVPAGPDILFHGQAS